MSIAEEILKDIEMIDERGKQYRTKVKEVETNQGLRHVRNMVEQATKRLINVMNPKHGSPNPKDEADKHIRSKLSHLVDFAVIDALAAVPDWLNMLSQYLSCVFAIARVYGAKRDAAEVTDLKFWQDMFN